MREAARFTTVFIVNTRGNEMTPDDVKRLELLLDKAFYSFLTDEEDEEMDNLLEKEETALYSKVILQKAKEMK